MRKTNQKRQRSKAIIFKLHVSLCQRLDGISHAYRASKGALRPGDQLRNQDDDGNNEQNVTGTFFTNRLASAPRLSLSREILHP
jgi:hypothetical protein